MLLITLHEHRLLHEYGGTSNCEEISVYIEPVAPLVELALYFQNIFVLTN